MVHSKPEGDENLKRGILKMKQIHTYSFLFILVYSSHSLFPYVPCFFTPSASFSIKHVARKIMNPNMNPNMCPNEHTPQCAFKAAKVLSSVGEGASPDREKGSIFALHNISETYRKILFPSPG